MGKEKRTLRKLSPEEAVRLYKKAKNLLRPQQVDTAFNGRNEYSCGVMEKMLAALFRFAEVDLQGFEELFSTDRDGTLADITRESSGFEDYGSAYIDVSNGYAKQEVYGRAGIWQEEAVGAEGFAQYVIRLAEEEGRGYDLLEACDLVDEDYMEAMQDVPPEEKEGIYGRYEEEYNEEWYDLEDLTLEARMSYIKYFSDDVRNALSKGVDFIESTYLNGFYNCCCVLDDTYCYRKQDFLEQLPALLTMFYGCGDIPFTWAGGNKDGSVVLQGGKVTFYDWGTCCAGTRNYRYPSGGKLCTKLYELPDEEEVEAFRWACECMSTCRYRCGMAVLELLNKAYEDKEDGIMFTRLEPYETSSTMDMFYLGASIAEIVAPLIINALAEVLCARYGEN